MGTTKTGGIQSDKNGNRTVDKIWRGQRIYARLGKITQEEAERWLANAIAHINAELDAGRGSGSDHCFVFADGAAEYLKELKGSPSAGITAWHIRMLLPYVGQLPLDQIHDRTLAAFKADRLAGLVGGRPEAKKPRPVSPTTVNRTLEVVRTVLNRAARVWRDGEGRPWLAVEPPLLSMLDEDRAKPYPLNWEEQDRFFPLLAPHLAEMALFAVNTGARDENVVGLKWEWEHWVEEVKRSVFIIPDQDYKTDVAHVLILNDAAWSIVQHRREVHKKRQAEGLPVSEYVFPYYFKTGPLKGQYTRIETMNNNGWQNARKKAKLPQVKVHSLRHTYASRLRLKGVSREDRATLLGHEGRGMPEHYAAADIGRMIQLSNLVLDRAGTMTLLRVVNG